MFSKKTLFAILSLVALAQAQSEIADTESAVEEPQGDGIPPFTVPQTCFKSGKMVSARNARSNVADETNAEELFTGMFDHTMKVSQITVCKDKQKRLTGMQLSLKARPPTDDEETKIVDRTVELAPIGNLDNVICDT